MLKTPQFLIDAVIAQQERKREELAVLQDAAKAAALAVEAAQTAYASAQEAVQFAKDELEQMREYLMKEKLASLSQSFAQAADASAAELGSESDTNESDSITIDGKWMTVSGRSLRKKVIDCALEIAEEKQYFSIDDVMSKLEEKKVVLGVENPRARVSQVLTLTKGFVHNEVFRAWTRSTSTVAASNAENAE